MLLQCRLSPVAQATEADSYTRLLGERAILEAISTLDDSFAWHAPAEILKGFDAVIIGGSGELFLDGGKSVDDPARAKAWEILERIRPLVDHIFATNTPLLGICFGHQLIAEIRGGAIKHDTEQHKVGSHEVSKNNDVHDSLFANMPDSFVAQYGHKDSVTMLPDGAEVLAKGERCNFSALRYGAHAYTFQFHPELTAAEVAGRLKNYPGYLPEGVSVEELVRESPEASELVPAFIRALV